jgi:hypothetical protein
MSVCSGLVVCEVVENSARDRKVVIATRDILPGEIVCTEKAVIYISKEMLSCDKLKLLQSETLIGAFMWAFLLEFEKFSCKKQKTLIESMKQRNSCGSRETKDILRNRLLQLTNRSAENVERAVEFWDLAGDKWITCEELEFFHLFSGVTLQFSHSCLPNCKSVIENGSCTMRSILPIKKGQQLTVDYSGNLDFAFTHLRRAHYLGRCAFFCTCPRCAAPGDDTRQFACSEKACVGRYFVCQPTSDAIPYLLPCTVCQQRPSDDYQVRMLKWEREAPAKGAQLEADYKKLKAAGMPPDFKLCKLLSEPKWPAFHSLSAEPIHHQLGSSIDPDRVIELAKDYAKLHDSMATFPKTEVANAYTTVAKVLFLLWQASPPWFQEAHWDLLRVATENCRKALQTYKLINGREYPHKPLETLLVQILTAYKHQIQRGLNCRFCDESASKAAMTLSKCGKCKLAVYCSVACQKAHWKIHKPLCVQMSGPGCEELHKNPLLLGENVHVFHLDSDMFR